MGSSANCEESGVTVRNATPSELMRWPFAQASGRERPSMLADLRG